MGVIMQNEGRKRPEKSESQLVYEVMQVLGRYGAVFRTNSGQFYAKNGQPVSGLPKGFSDVLFIRPDGRACFIELKTGGNETSPEQEKFIERMQKLSAVAGKVRSAAEALRLCGVGNNADITSEG